MAILQSISFETGDISEANTGATGTYSIQNTVVRLGSYALRTNPTTTAAGNLFIVNTDGGGFNITTGYVSFYFRYGIKPTSNNEPICIAYAAGAIIKLEIRINSTGTLSVYDSAGALVSTGTTVLDPNIWYWIDFSCTNGTAYTLRINSNIELQGTATQGANNFNEIRIGKVVNRNGNTVDFYYADIRVDDSTFPTTGWRSKQALITGNGFYTGWTGDYTNVNTWSLTDDVSYITTSTLNTRESFTHQFVSDIGSDEKINCIKILGVGRELANAVFAFFVRSETTDSEGAGQNLTTTYEAFSEIWLTDPATSQPWTTAGFNASQVGVIHKTSQVRAIRFTAMLVVIDFDQRIQRHPAINYQNPAIL